MEQYQVTNRGKIYAGALNSWNPQKNECEEDFHTQTSNYLNRYCAFTQPACAITMKNALFVLNTNYTIFAIFSLKSGIFVAKRILLHSLVIALCSYPLKLGRSKILKSKGPVFTQFCSKFKNFSFDW